ncbi:3-hydroxyisobutyryl-CoA hydrolase-like protein 2-mitochondrial [Striga hermonthica]|uniref:3-hydroxyisobutyryl-CoA hydrolase n=1 Tax=Striga hermonthica TaxID=68872 RepID=A0A9N7RNX8_STRHE|nr:3-hydroxyisobutyryl-CoA hydrolase-like protein 2-mitochondrial [Striga hermonthica]
MADTHNPTGAGGLRRRNMPYNPYLMAAAGLAAIGGAWYFYNNRRKPDQSARPVHHNKLKLLLPFVRSLQRNGSVNRQSRCFSALPSYTQPDYLQQEEVLVQGRANSRMAILNRPSALNAITASMAARLNRLYESWEENSTIGFVMMKGGGERPFCSGTDVVALYRLFNEGKTEECKALFQSLYKFVYVMGTYLKPHLAIMDGIVMGGGAGISLPGMFRVVSDRTVFSTPEVQIGFHPDAGASYYLSRLPGYLGEYLALTGEKLNGVEMMACGLATHYSLKEKLPWIEERLGNLITDDRSVIESSLAQYGCLEYPDSRSVLHEIETIDSFFCYDTVEEIVEALENQASEPGNKWHTTVLNKIKEASPLSLKVTLQSVREGRFQTLDQCLTREYRTSLRFISKHISNDFTEGVRARLVDKDFAPKWGPPKLEDVTDDMVDSFFLPLGELELELNLPVAVREPDV